MIDVNVQYFSHLNGLSLGNNWGDLINLLDVCLVNGLPFSSITSATISELGDINLTLSTAHNAMLFQIVELSGFSPSTLNKKYRIKGVPSTTQLILKADLTNTIISAVGAAKLASLGYDLPFTAQGKRVYRAKNPTAQHPFIRVDETISDGTNTYTESYAKYAMVGLIENMTHIDDYEDPSKLQLPLDTADFKKNWKITGTGTSVVRGWSKWYWTRSSQLWAGDADYSEPLTGDRNFTLVGDQDAFYFITQLNRAVNGAVLMGAGLYSHSMQNDVVPNWFLMARTRVHQASETTSFGSVQTGMPLMYSESTASFYTTNYSVLSRIKNSAIAIPIMPDYESGSSDIFSATSTAALEIPFKDNSKYLRGTLKHVAFSGNRRNLTKTTALLSDQSMYVYDSVVSATSTAGLYFYLGELE